MTSCRTLQIREIISLWQKDSIVATLARKDGDLGFGKYRFQNRRMAREYYAISPAKARNKLNLAQEPKAAPFIPLDDPGEAEIEPLPEQVMNAIKRALRHLCGAVGAHILENDGIGYTLRTNHAGEYRLEVRRTGLVYTYGQPLQDRPAVEPMLGRHKKREDNTWRYEWELFIGRDPRNAKLLKAAPLRNMLRKTTKARRSRGCTEAGKAARRNQKARKGRKRAPPMSRASGARPAAHHGVLPLGEEMMIGPYRALHELRVERRRVKNELSALFAAVKAARTIPENTLAYALDGIDAYALDGIEQTKNQKYKCRTVPEAIPEWLKSVFAEQADEGGEEASGRP